MRFTKLLSDVRSAVRGFIISQRVRRKDIATREAAVRGPIYVLTKVATHIAGAAYNDLVYGRQKSVTKGAVALKDRAAIYLIYPENGVLQSHRDSLTYMRDKGYAPIVVSNLPLSHADRQSLLSSAHLVIERFNYGYDFGGYREGVLALKQQLGNIETLAFLNDSAWFPIRPDADWLGEAEAMDLDFVGASWGNFVHSSLLQDIKTFQFSFDPGFRTFHYQSYALLCRKDFIRSRRFLKFWRRFPLTQLKHLTIRRGEIGFSQLAISNGFSHGATLDPEKMVARLNELSDDKLIEILRSLAVMTYDKSLPQERQMVLAALKIDRSKVIDVILITISRHSVVNVASRYLIENAGFCFLKKPPLWLSRDSSSKMIELLSNLEGPFAKTLRSEAAMLVQQKVGD